MIGRVVTFPQLQECASSVGLRIEGKTEGNRVIFTLKRGNDPELFRSMNPRPEGIEWLGGKAISLGWKFRKGTGVCFHGHWAFMKAVFQAYPMATIESTYYGRVKYTADTFESEARKYGDTPLGTGDNIYAGFRLRDKCNCEH